MLLVSMMICIGYSQSYGWVMENTPSTIHAQHQIKELLIYDETPELTALTQQTRILSDGLQFGLAPLSDISQRLKDSGITRGAWYHGWYSFRDDIGDARSC